MQTAAALDKTLAASELAPKDWPKSCASSSADDIDDAWDARSIDLECMRHVAAAKRLTKQFDSCSIALDKADIRGCSMQNGSCVVGTNVGFALIPQVAAPLHRALFQYMQIL